jgi:hypothetical protein
MLLSDVARMPTLSADPILILETVGTVVALLALIGLAVATFVWMRNCRRQLTEEPAVQESIEVYRQLLDEGLLERDEFERITTQLHKLSDTPAGPTKPESPSQSLP